MSRSAPDSRLHTELSISRSRRFQGRSAPQVCLVKLQFGRSLPINLPLIIGHRGNSAEAPENTIAAFARALNDGADGIEFDVRLARDRTPVVIHDATLKRTGGLPAAVSALSSAELTRLDVGSWFNRKFKSQARAEYALETVPTLGRLLEFMAGNEASL